MNIIQQIEQEQIAKLTSQRAVPEFAPGDTLRVNVKVIEGTRERVQAFEGVCIARSLSGLNSSFTVRKISFGEGVERVFPLYSPRIASIEIVRRGDVRRAKLYYLRGRTGKKARILEKTGAATASEMSEAELLEGLTPQADGTVQTPAQVSEKAVEAAKAKEAAKVAKKAEARAANDKIKADKKAAKVAKKAEKRAAKKAAPAEEAKA